MTPLRTISFVGLGLLLGLGGCTTTPEPTPKPVAAKPAPAKSVKQAKKPTRKPVKPEAEPAPAPAPAAEVAVEPAAIVAPPPAPTVVVPVDVLGKSEADVIALLGRPAQEQVASAAKVMRFTAEGCAVEVHLFADVKQGGYRVLETTAAGAGTAPQCLGKVRAGRG